MKKIIYLFAVLGVAFLSSCTPMDDINAEIDAQLNPIVGDAVFTLTDDDYADLGLSYGSFSSLDDAKADLPDFLKEKYPVWGKGSSALVGYKLYVGKAFSIDEYTLDQDDYTTSGSDLLGFQSDVTPADYLADFLADNLSYSDDGDYAIAKYFQYSGAVVILTPTVSLEENFDYGSTAGDLTTISAGAWTNHSGADNQLMYGTTSLTMTDYPSIDVAGSIMLDAAGSEDVSTFISAPVTSGTMYASTLINLSVVGDGTYSFHFADDSYGYSARVGAKTDGNGGVLFGIGATSSTLTYGTTSFALNTTYLLVSSYNIDNGIANLYILTSAEATEPDAPEATSTGDAGKAVARIALRQGYGGPTATLDGIRVANTWSAIMTNDALEDVVIGDKVSYNVFYTLSNGIWEEATDGLYVLTSDDYDAMGTAYGLPGKYNNFDGSMDINGYISTFLGIKYPFAQEDDNIDVIYKYYSSSAHATQTRGNSYTVVDGAWAGFESTISTTLQFGHDGVVWVPDNTIKYTLTQADYELVGNGNYGNFDVRAGKDEELESARLAKINTILLNNFPGMAEGQKYAVSYNVYSGAAEVWEMRVVLSGGVYVLQ